MTEEQRYDRDFMGDEVTVGLDSKPTDGASGPAPVTLDTVDSADMLRFSFATIDAMRAIAAQWGGVLTFRGFHAKPGSALLVTNANDGGCALKAAAELYALTSVPMTGDVPPAVARFYDTLRNVSSKYAPRATVSGQTFSFKAVPAEQGHLRRSLTQVRATVIRVNATRPDSIFVRLASPEELYPYTLKTDLDTARQAGNCLQALIDADVEIHRGPDGRIDGGELLAFKRVFVDAEPGAAWRAWFRDNFMPDDVLDVIEGSDRD